MARNKGTAGVGFDFQVKAALPLDSRTRVENLTDLTSAETWTTDGSLYIYEGMQVYVIAQKKKYTLTDPTNYNNMAAWTESGSQTVVDTLMSDTSENPVQNKVIKEYIDATAVELTQAEYDALTQEEKMNGTVYYITDGVSTGGSGGVDAVLSTTSTNPVQNKVIATAIGDIETILQTLNTGGGA